MPRSLTLFFTLMLGMNLAYADSVSLHQEPKDGSAVTASIDLTKGVVPIYTPANSDWIKVADPSNGNVGWIKQSDFKNANSASIKINQQTVGPDGKIEKSGINLQVGKPIDMNDPKVKANLDEIRKLQENVQRNMKTQIQDMVNGMNNLYQKQLKLLEDSGYYVPAKSNSPAQAAPVNNAVKP
jgi:hypothetical protein